MIDLSVWGLALVVIVGLGGFIFTSKVFDPRLATVADRQAELRGQCLREPANGQMSSAMRDAFCGCVATEPLILGVVSAESIAQCRRAAARSQANDPGLAKTFASTFSRLCQGFESRALDREVAPDSPYCSCLATMISKDRGRMAEYVLLGNEARSRAAQHDYDFCSTQLTYGKGWKGSQDGTAYAATMDLPDDFKEAHALEFSCKAGVVRFRALDKQGKLLADEVGFADEFDTLTIGPETTGGRVWDLLDRLRAIDQPDVTYAATNFVASKRQLLITTTGLTAATAPILAACPPPTATAPVVASNLPDNWQVISPGTALLGHDGDETWTFALTCDDGELNYLAISSRSFETLGKRFPDPEGQVHAADVPITLNGQPLAQGSVCDFGQEGADETCYAMLDPAVVKALASQTELTVDVAGKPFPAVAFGNSRAIRSVMPACLR